MVSGMQGTPQQPNPTRVGLRIPVRLSTDDSPAVEAPQAQPESGEGEIPPMPEAIPDPLVRRTPITYKEVEKYGPTPGCTGCQAKTRGEVTRRGHSEKCRRRMEELMRQDVGDKKKIERGEERITHKIAKDIEKADRKRKAEEERSEAAAQEEQGEKGEAEGVSKRAKPTQEEQLIDQGDPASESSSGPPGGASGATGETLKRKREESDEDRGGDPGMDIDRVESLGGILSRISICDPELETWSRAINDQKGLAQKLPPKINGFRS